MVRKNINLLTPIACQKVHWNKERKATKGHYYNSFRGFEDCAFKKYRCIRFSQGYAL